MKRTRRMDAIAFSVIEDGVERPGPGQAPTAFRIWRFGENPTDHGMTVFSERSADLLMIEQTARNNLYSVDVDHMSLNSTSPVEARKAVGWHRLEVRDDGLWAVGVEWTPAVKSGLETDPPEWRYFSPAYDQDSNGEVVSYLNTALTNNPATWGVTALATRAEGVRKMAISKADMVAFLQHASGNQEGAAAICDAILAVLNASAKKDADPPAEPDGDEPKAEPKGEPDGDEGEEAKKDTRTSTDAKVIALLTSLQAERDAEKEAARKAKEAEERATLIKAHRMPADVKAWLESESTTIQSVRDACRALPKADEPTNPAAAQFITATRRSPDAVGPGLPEDQAKRLDSMMGIRPQEDAIKYDAEKRVGYLGVMYGAQGRAEAQRILARRAPKGGV